MKNMRIPVNYFMKNHPFLLLLQNWSLIQDRVRDPGGALCSRGDSHRACSQSFVLAELGGRDRGKTMRDKELGKVTGTSLEGKAGGTWGIGGQTELQFPDFKCPGYLKILTVCRVGAKKTENRNNSLKSCLPSLKWEQWQLKYVWQVFV